MEAIQQIFNPESNSNESNSKTRKMRTRPLRTTFRSSPNAGDKRDRESSTPISPIATSIVGSQTYNKKGKPANSGINTSQGVTKQLNKKRGRSSGVQTSANKKPKNKSRSTMRTSAQQRKKKVRILEAQSNPELVLNAFINTKKSKKTQKDKKVSQRKSKKKTKGLELFNKKSKKKTKGTGLYAALFGQKPLETEVAQEAEERPIPQEIIYPADAKIHSLKDKKRKQLDSKEQTELYIREPGIRYVEVFADKFQTEINKQLNSQTKSSAEKIKEFELSPKTYAAQCAEKLQDPLLKPKFDELYTKYSLLIDYVDMVHDITKCIDYIKNIGLPKALQDDIRDLIDKLCGGSFASIRIPASHVLQRNYLLSFVGELKKLGFTLPDVQSPTIVTLDNAEITLDDIDCCARESGRYLEEWVKKSPNEKVKNKSRDYVVNNALGAIDGCKGECDASQEVEWSHTVAGVIDMHIKTKNNKSIITVTIVGDTENWIFKVDGEIKLDDVIDLLPPGDNLPKRRESRNVESNITPPPNADLKNPKYLMAVIALKTICDKRLLQLIQNDRDGKTTGQNGTLLKKLTAITTVDGYVWAGTLLAYLGNKIDYCPAILFRRDYGFERFDFEKSSNILDELTHRYTFYEDYLKYYDKETDSRTRKAFDFTDKYINARIAELKERDFINLWDFIRTMAIANQKNNWKAKKSELHKKVDLVFDIENGEPIEKEKLINALLSIPTTIPSLVEFFGELEDQEDLYGEYDYTPDIGSLYGAFIARKEDDPINDTKIFNDYFNNNISVWPNVTCSPEQDSSKKCISEFIKKYKIKIKKSSQSRDFLPKSITSQNLAILNTDDILIGSINDSIKAYISEHSAQYYLRIEYTSSENEISNEFKKDVEFFYSEKLPSLITTAGNEVLFVPCTAEFLINFAMNLSKLPAARNVDKNEFLKLIAEKLFTIIGGWLNLNERDHLSSFQRFFKESIMDPTKKFKEIWRENHLPLKSKTPSS
jgi:hypothetical protein